jgi:hypothetical protein
VTTLDVSFLVFFIVGAEEDDANDSDGSQILTKFSEVRARFRLI